ncbi:MAG TPA: hypothetical protein VHC69_26830 [Polyangiaceae bacterium]|nr:hypothetical protein [Polyangiaceae bacterium]
MDAEKFDKVVLDLLYEELDELTRASAIRHTEQSGRAKALYSELRATREVGALPLVEPPSDLEERILQAEESARRERPLRQRFGSFVSIAASYAMRPQLGMAAVLLLMVGSSLLLLRVKPGAPSSVQVTERGVPESEKDSVTVVPVPRRAAPPVAAEPLPAPAAEQPRAARSRAEAPKGDVAPSPRPAATQSEKTSAVAAAPPPENQPAPADELGGSPTDDVAAAEAAPGAVAGGAAAKTEEGSATGGASAGCDTDLPRYESILASAGAHSAGEVDAARFAAAQCYQRLGRVDAARRSYRLLVNNATYGEAARRALSILPESTARVAESAPAEPAAKPAKPAASKPSP